MKQLAVLLSFLFSCLLLAVPAQADFWADCQLRAQAEAEELEVADDGYINPKGIYTTRSWWFNGKQGVISRLVVYQEIFFLQGYSVCTSVNQPWLHEFGPGFDHFFEGTKKVGVVKAKKNYAWFDSDWLWEYPITRYYQRHDGKSFFRLHHGSTWVFWIIDPLAEVETPFYEQKQN